MWAAVCHHHVLLKGSRTEQLTSWKLDWSQFRPWLDPACCTGGKLFKSKPEKAAKRNINSNTAGPPLFCIQFTASAATSDFPFCFAAVPVCPLSCLTRLWWSRYCILLMVFVNFVLWASKREDKLLLRGCVWGDCSRCHHRGGGVVHECVWCLCCISCGRCLRRSVGMTWGQADAPSDSPEPSSLSIFLTRSSASTWE